MGAVGVRQVQAGGAWGHIARPGLAHAGGVEVRGVLQVQIQQRLVFVVAELHHPSRFAVVHHQEVRLSTAPRHLPNAVKFGSSARPHSWDVTQAHVQQECHAGAGCHVLLHNRLVKESTNIF